MERSAGENQNAATAPGNATACGPFVSRLTAQGRGAIAVLRVWGPRAIEVADSVFRQARGVRLAEGLCGVLRLGKIGRGPGDEVVAVVLDEEPPAVEVQCHGGAAAVALVVEALREAGAKTYDLPRLPGRRAEGPFASDALADLARAPTLLTAEILLDQVHGALDSELLRLSRSIDAEPGRAVADLDTLIGRAQIGLRLLSGWRVAIIGRPNVGKSRLFNALVGFARAIVDPTPGTTRDVVSLEASFAGWPVELADTAGIREALDPVEGIGIERSRREQREADLIVLVLDRSEFLQSIDHELIATNPAAILVANKSDLPPAWRPGDPHFRARAVETVSAERGDGLERLVDTIIRRLVPEPPPAGAAVPFRMDQLNGLHQIRTSLLSAQEPATHDVAAHKKGTLLIFDEE